MTPSKIEICWSRGDETIILTVAEYNALMEEIEVLQDSIDALTAQAQIQAEGTKRKDLTTFMAELEADGLLNR